MSRVESAGCIALEAATTRRSVVLSSDGPALASFSPEPAMSTMLSDGGGGGRSFLQKSCGSEVVRVGEEPGEAARMEEEHPGAPLEVASLDGLDEGVHRFSGVDRIEDGPARPGH